ncbi:phage head-tail connector protein [Enterococcus casseliflavus]|uniref:phage head-tail connector protein n=1 Tax=Enterococcus casseliflavus TaxID=37734 RepID=UPI002890DCA6|nr:phage head-tail connector protein [Enterococcus casseliflavus]MDT2954243.1 phage head-tail connector protein [Enterococcus casseliflavus]MDT2957513.1 phage head-tail connector protein [Enterococcus casseliflavus]
MAIKDDVKKLLSGSTDDKLEVIEKRTRERLASLLGVSVIPDSLEYIVFDVTNKRFNRVGQEGMSSYSQEGLSMAFPDSDFSEYGSEIDSFKRKDVEDLYKPKQGGVYFV